MLPFRARARTGEHGVTVFVVGDGLGVAVELKCASEALGEDAECEHLVEGATDGEWSVGFDLSAAGEEEIGCMIMGAPGHIRQASAHFAEFFLWLDAQGRAV